MRNILLATILLIAANGCTKKEVDPVSFDITTASATYNVGDSVTFTFSGNPDYILFYSGENGHQYQFRNRVTAVGTPILNFLSYEQFGNHTNTLHLLVSNDFNGKFDSADVKNATWTDITNRANLSTGQNNTASGNISLTDFISQDTPVYVAFKFADQKDGINAQRTWTITQLSLINKLQDSTSTTLLDIAYSAWLGVNILNPAALWSISTTALKIAGGAKTAPSSESWAVSQPINLTRVQPDTGVSIKTLTDPALKTFSYVYTKPGIYTIVFAATNANVNSQTTATKTLNITVQ